MTDPDWNYVATAIAIVIFLGIGIPLAFFAGAVQRYYLRFGEPSWMPDRLTRPLRVIHESAYTRWMIRITGIISLFCGVGILVAFLTS